MANLSRRGFITSAAIGAAAVAGGVLTGCSSSSSSSSAANIKWAEETDVIVCGAGGTGLAASCAAAEAGAQVLCLEEQSQSGGTTALSGGVFQAAGTEWQKEFTSFQNDTPAIHARCYVKQAEGIGEEDLITTLCDAAPDDLKWLESIGTEWTSVYGNCHVPYCDAENLHADRIHVYKGGGAAGGGKIVTDLETAAAQNLGVTFEYDVTVESLITDGDNGIIGVVAKKDGSDVNIKAKRGVVLGLGGIDRNEDLAKALNQQQYWDLTTQKSYIATTATGDGIRMGLEVGAALATVGGCIDYDLATGNATTNAVAQIPCIFVNANGKRFVCEDATYAYTYRAIFQQATQLDGDTWMVLDQSMVEQKLGPWYSDIDSAVAKGTLLTADTYESLAEAMGVPAQTLAQTMNDWNANIAQTGEDLDWHRNTQLIQLDKPPYYAYKNVSANLGSLGGLKINVDAQVISLSGDPIPHLFSGGMNSGGWYGLYYPGSGTSLTGGLAWGRIAGANAASTTSWE